VRKRLSKFLRGTWVYPSSVVLGFLEGSFVVVAMEPLFIPMMVTHKRGIWLIAAGLLAGNVLGALLMYAFGMWLDQPVIEPLASWMGFSEEYHGMIDTIGERGFWPLFLIGITPFPFQLGTAAAGAAGYNLALFVAAVTLSRGLRYFALAGFVRLLGYRARDFLEKHEVEIFVLGLGIFIGAAAYMILTA
jgi:membrane protein YqaA with SNARE-associated domain